MAGLAKLWTNSVFKEGWAYIAYPFGTCVRLLYRPEHMRCLMGYVVNLTLILQAVFQASLQDHIEGKVTMDSVDEIIYEFHCSEKKRNIHDAIRKCIETRYFFARSNVVNVIASLIEKNEVRSLSWRWLMLIVCRRCAQMTEEDTKLDRGGPTLRLLLPILRFEVRSSEALSRRRWRLPADHEWPCSKPNYPWPCAWTASVTKFSWHCRQFGSFRRRTITWFHSLCLYSFYLAFWYCYSLP